MKRYKSAFLFAALGSLTFCQAADSSLLLFSRTTPGIQDVLTSGLITAVAVDDQAYTYIAGSTQLRTLATTPNSIQPDPPEGENGFVIKLNPAGDVVFATYLGGRGFDRATSIAVDLYGYIYIGGITVPYPNGLPDFPVTSPSPFPGSAYGTSFVTKLTPDGTRLVYSAIIPGTSGKTAVVAEPRGVLHFVTTGGPGFPVTPGAPQGRGSIVTGKLDERGTLVYAARFGGSSPDETPSDIVLDGNYNSYITGTTSSTDFPVTAGAFQTTLHGKSAAFAAKLSADGTSLIYATYMSGTIGESGRQIRVDAYGNAFVLGASHSMDFPVTQGAYQRYNIDTNNTAFLAKLNPTGTGLAYATYVPGVVGLNANADPVASFGGFDIDGPGNAYIATKTTGGLQTTKGAFQPNVAGGTDAGIIKLDKSGQRQASSYFGGSRDDVPSAIAVSTDGIVTFAGVTNSSNFPLTSSPSPTGNVSFVSRFEIWPDATKPPDPTYFQIGDGEGESIIVRFTKPDGIRAAWEMMRGRKWVQLNGKIVRSTASYSPKWNFHVDTGSATVGDATTEACDAVLPIIAEGGDNLGGNFLPNLVWCPWGTEIQAEIPPPADEANHIIHVSAADHTEVAMAPGSLVAGFGTNLASDEISAPPGTAPPSLGGVSVSLKDSAGVQWAAPLLYVSPKQINYQLPGTLVEGRYSVTVNTSDHRAITEQIYVQPFSPSIFTVGSSNYLSGYITRVKADGTTTTEPIVQVDPKTGDVTPIPIDFGPETDQLYLIVYATGVRTRPSVDSIFGQFLRVSIPTYLNPAYVGPSPSMAGLDQMNFPLPRQLAGAGNVLVQFKSAYTYPVNPDEQHAQFTDFMKISFK